MFLLVFDILFLVVFLPERKKMFLYKMLKDNRPVCVHVMGEGLVKRVWVDAKYS